MYRGYGKWLVALFLFWQACSSSGDSNTALLGGQSGKVQISLTDAPANGMDHVWVTVKALWLNTSETAEPEHTGWVKLPLSAPITLDLLEYNSGVISAPLWNDVDVPEGDYTQMRIFLVRTEAILTASAEDAGLSYNNQVTVSDVPYPLRVPEAERGIMLTGQFSVKKNEKLKLAIDFDAGHDIVEIDRDGSTEYVLKPRLAFFDLQNAGAIVGSIDSQATGSNAVAQFVIKAEQSIPTQDGNGVHVVRRVTFLDPQNPGRFVLYPLHPGIYDIVIRGINYQTTIIRNVPVVKDTTPLLQNDPTIISEVTMTAASPSALDHPINATIVSPTGAWVDFLQTIPGESAPYEIRFRHFNPLTGRILGFPLSEDQIQVGTYDGPNPIAFTAVDPVGGKGTYKAVAGAPLHEPDLTGKVVTVATTTLSFDTLPVLSPLENRRVSGTISVPETMNGANGVLFACHGGMIVNAIPLTGVVSGQTYTISNLPGGGIDVPLPGAYYAIEAFGWTLTDKAVTIPRFVDLARNNATDIDLTMVALPHP